MRRVSSASAPHVHGGACRTVATCPTDLTDWGDEAVPTFWDGFDVLSHSLLFPQRLPQRKDVVGQVSFLDEAVRPHQLHQFAFLKQPATVFDEDPQDLEGLGHQGHGRPLA